MLLSLPAAPVKNQDGAIWHVQWRALVAQFDDKVNPITKLLAAGTDQPGWTPRSPYVDSPPPPPVDYGYYPDLLQPKNLITLARREFERYLWHRWQTRRDQLKGRYPIEPRFLRPDAVPAEVAEAKRFVEHKINTDALQRWNEDVRELRLHELTDAGYPLPILRGDSVTELDINKLAVRSLPRLIAQEKEITQKIQSVSQWKLLEPTDLGLVAKQLMHLAFPVEEKDPGRLVHAWLSELERDPELQDIPSSSAETVALRVSTVINRAILYEWETLTRSMELLANTLRHYCAQEVERFLQRFQEEQQAECRRAQIPEFPLPVLSVVQVKRGQLVEHASRADLAARRLGQLAVVCLELGWLFRPVVPDADWWPLNSLDEKRLLIRRDPSCDARAKLAQSWQSLREMILCAASLLEGPKDKLRRTMRQMVESELGRLAQLYLTPLVEHYQRLWQRDKEDREALCERYRRTHARAIFLCEHLTKQDYPVTPELARQVMEMLPDKKLKPRDVALLSLGQYLNVPEGVLSTTASTRDLALAQYRYWDETPQKSFRQLISLWISQLY